MEKKTTPKKTRKQPALTLLQAIEAVAERSRDSKMSADFLKASEAEINFLAEQYGISERQDVIFAICMDEGPYRVDYRDLAEHFDFSGGQIENEARKHAINSILYGTGDEMLPVLESYCRCEQLNNSVTRKRIGF